MKRIIMLSSLLLVIISLAGCGQSEKAGQTPTIEPVSTLQESAPLETNKQSSNNQTSQNLQGSTAANFEEKFKQCLPATTTLAPMKDVSYHYEIIGKKEGLCEVKSKFISNPNPSWVGKEMICKYDSSKNFGVAVQDMSKCSGELYNLMTGK